MEMEEDKMELTQDQLMDDHPNIYFYRGARVNVLRIVYEIAVIEYEDGSRNEVPVAELTE